MCEPFSAVCDFTKAAVIFLFGQFSVQLISAKVLQNNFCDIMLKEEVGFEPGSPELEYPYSILAPLSRFSAHSETLWLRFSVERFL